MNFRNHKFWTLLKSMLLAMLISLPALAQAQDWEDHLSEWEQLEHQRAALESQLQNLERDHQKFVTTIEKLKSEYAQGQASRRELESGLRENLATVESLEILQRQLQEVDLAQATLRRQIVQGIDEHRKELEKELRQASSSQMRLELVAELNNIQDQRRKYSVPLPTADQQRVDQALQLARSVDDVHPRAMLSAADELEDTEDQLLARLSALDRRIDELEQARQLYRRNRNFGDFDRFFDDHQRARTLARYEQASSINQSDDRNTSAGGDERFARQDDGPPAQIYDGTRGTTPVVSSDDESANNSSDNFPDPNEPPEYDYEPVETETSPDPTNDIDDVPPQSDEPITSPDDPFDDGSSTETIVIENEIDPDQVDDIFYFNVRAIGGDIQRLLNERDTLREQAEQLRKKAEQLRNEARQSR